MVALDLALTDDLRRRGLLRDVVRQVQDLRKSSGFDVADRIVLHLEGLDDLAEDYGALASEVLATRVEATRGVGEGTDLELDDGRAARVWVTRVI